MAVYSCTLAVAFSRSGLAPQWEGNKEGSYIWGEAQKTSRAATHSRTSVSALAMFMATDASFLALLATPLALLTAVLLVRLNLAHA